MTDGDKEVLTYEAMKAIVVPKPGVAAAVRDGRASVTASQPGVDETQIQSEAKEATEVTPPAASDTEHGVPGRPSEGTGVCNDAAGVALGDGGVGGGGHVGDDGRTTSGLDGGVDGGDGGGCGEDASRTQAADPTAQVQGKELCE